MLAALFIFSGFVKAVDPLGSFYKIQDYLTAFGIISWFPAYLPLLFAIVLSSAEFCVGVFLFFGVRRKIASTLALLLMGVMTPLTLYLALANPVSDCGCFGDAWVLTNWETFGKNIVLLFAAMMAFRHRRMLVRFISVKMEWLVSLYTLFFVFTLSFYCLDRLPVLDFRPYKIGKNILEGMTMPEGAKPSVYESIFILEKNGEKKEFTLDNYPDSTWTFVDTRTILKEKGYILNYKFEEDGVRSNIKIALKYHPETKVPAIKSLVRVSKPGLRRYTNVEEMPRVLNGLGIAILSTSMGLMTDKEARQRNIGGEVLCYVY